MTILLPSCGLANHRRPDIIILKKTVPQDIFCCAQLRPSTLSAFAKSLACTLDGFDLSILSTN